MLPNTRRSAGRWRGLRKVLRAITMLIARPEVAASRSHAWCRRRVPLFITASMDTLMDIARRREVACSALLEYDHDDMLEKCCARVLYVSPNSCCVYCFLKVNINSVCFRGAPFQREVESWTCFRVGLSLLRGSVSRRHVSYCTARFHLQWDGIR
jgi:hypothetical protein